MKPIKVGTVATLSNDPSIVSSLHGEQVEVIDIQQVEPVLRRSNEEVVDGVKYAAHEPRPIKSLVSEVIHIRFLSGKTHIPFTSTVREHLLL